MNNPQSILQNIIADFSSQKFTRFFREVSVGNFRELDYDISSYNNDDFSNGTLLGQIEMPDAKIICVITLSVNKSLSERSGKKAQYELAKKYLKNNEKYNAGIFIFYDTEGNFRFSLIFDIPQPKGKRDWSSFKRFTYFVSKRQTNKTFITRIGSADFNSFDQLRDAFSVDKVTKDFYREIAGWYFWAMDNIEFPDDEDKNADERNAKNLIRLITRIIFVWFMKEKNLVPPALFEKETIDKIINYKDSTGSTYYKAILQNLFFATLNTKMKRDEPDSRIFIEEAKKKGFLNEGYLQQGYYRYSRFVKDKELFLKLFENIPFLNGGLFESLDKKVNGKEIRIDCFSNNTKNESRLKVPDELFFLEEELSVDLSNHLSSGKNKNVRGLLPILKSYNFTIDENTPIDEEVALDPELLGKVFENLLASYNPQTATTARKSSGSYYTPREIVEYMVNESLVENLKTALGIEDKDDEVETKIRNLFDYNKEENPFADDKNTTEKIIDAIEKVKILDPACGSGAFPMGILHKLVLALHKLDPENKIWKKRLLERVPAEIREETEISLHNKPLDYVRKLGLIENCIYGVDIQEIAIQISKLRFFISLLVEQEIDDSISNRDVKPLPNLETKFVAANTLIGLGKLPEELIDSEITTLSKKLFDLRRELFYSNSRSQKKILEEKEEKLRGNIEQALQDKYHKVIVVKINKLEMEVNELNKTLLQLKNEPEEIETIDTTNLFGERETKKINKTKEKINRLTRRLNDCHKQIEEFKNPKNDTSTEIAHKIANWDPFDQNRHADWFDPEWMFGVKDGFDVVIGNPPYVNIKGKGKQKNKYRTYKTLSSCDLFAYFFEKSTDILKENGCISLITSSLYVKGLKFETLRKLLEENYKLNNLQIQGDKVFNNVQLPTATFIGLKSKNNNSWSFREFTFNPILDKMSKDSVPLGTITDSMRGLEIGRDKLSVKGVYKIISGSEIERYNIKSIKYISEATFRKFKKNAYFFKGDRILLRETGSILTAVYVNKDDLLSSRTLFSLKIINNRLPYKYLLALINSKLLQYYYEVRFKADTDIFPKIRMAQARELPIRESYKIFQNRIDLIVDNILKEKKQNPQANTQQLEDQIDIMVYKLYELTYEEVKIIDADIEKIISKEEYESKRSIKRQNRKI